MTLNSIRARRRRRWLCNMRLTSSLPSFVSRPQLHRLVIHYAAREQLLPVPTLLQLLLVMALLLLLGGDIESNPGPPTRPLPQSSSAAAICLLCDQHGRKTQNKIYCGVCGQCFHSRCLKLSKDETKLYRTTSYTCWSCTLPNFADSLFDSSSENLDITNSASSHEVHRQINDEEKATQQTAETSRSWEDSCKKNFVQPQVSYSRPMTRGAIQARKRAIIAYKKSVWALKIHLADYNIEETQVNGLVNLGVTCYLNSILQCLARTPLFLNELIRTFDDQTIQLPGDPSKGVEGLQVSLDSWGPVTHKLANRLTALLLKVSTENPVDPEFLVQILKEILEMEFNHQQDAHELLIILLDTLREEYEVKLSAKIEEAIKPKFTSKEDANRALQMYEQQARQAAFGPTVLFQGLVTSTIRCDTLKDSVARSESFTTLSLPIASSRKRSREEGAVEPVEEEADHFCTLHYCLQQFMAAQCMIDYDCSRKNCPKEGGKHTMQSEIKVAPRILVLHLKRFKIDNKRNIKKIDVHVSFPSILNIADFCDANCRGSGNVLYGLYGVVHHSGTPTGGHFIADVKVRHPRYLLNGTLPNDTQWYVMDDGNATKTSESCVLRRQAYLLFYEKLVQ